MQMLFFFKETEIPIPQTYREIDHTLNMVRTLLKQYQEQTKYVFLRLMQNKLFQYKWD